MLSNEVLEDILKSELEAKTFPHSWDDAQRYVVSMASEAGQTTSAWDDDDDSFDDEGTEDGAFFDDDEDDDFDDEDFDVAVPSRVNPQDLPPQAMALVAEIMAKHGRLPTPDELSRFGPRVAASVLAVLRSMAQSIGLNAQDTAHDVGGAGGGRGRANKKKRRR